MGLASTLPGACETLFGYLQNAAQDNRQLDCGVYFGLSSAQPKQNFLMVGHDVDGTLILPDTYQWAALPGYAQLISEDYVVQLTIQTWSGSLGADARRGRLGDAFGLWNNVDSQITADLTGSGTLSPSGSWGRRTVRMRACGPLGGQGFGVVLSVEVGVLNVQIPPFD